MKERYAVTELRKQANRMNFGEVNFYGAWLSIIFNLPMTSMGDKPPSPWRGFNRRKCAKIDKKPALKIAQKWFKSVSDMKFGICK